MSFYVKVYGTDDVGDEYEQIVGPFRGYETAQRMIDRINAAVDFDGTDGGQPAPRASGPFLFATFNQVLVFIEQFRPEEPEEIGP